VPDGTFRKKLKAIPPEYWGLLFGLFSMLAARITRLALF
jgi:hypothetical protein